MKFVEEKGKGKGACKNISVVIVRVKRKTDHILDIALITPHFQVGKSCEAGPKPIIAVNTLQPCIEEPNV